MNRTMGSANDADAPLHEPNRVSSRGVLAAAAGLAAVVALGVLASAGLLMRLIGRPPIDAAPVAVRGEHREPPVSPPLAQDRPHQRRELRQAEERILSTYAWLDPEAGIARVPIDRAMEMVVASQPTRKSQEDRP